MERRMSAGVVVLASVLGLSLHGAFVAPGSTAPTQAHKQTSGADVVAVFTSGSSEEIRAPLVDLGMATRFFAGMALAAVVLVTSGPARADIEDVAIPVDGKGKTVNLTKEEIIRGKRLFNAACSYCHVGGGTRTNQNVGLGWEELSGAQPQRNSIDGMVDYLNSPTTYDGLKDISEVHPSIRAADIWPKMRTMKQKDLYDVSAYILYQNFVIPEKWGGGKQYY
jgi:photosystem II cytochrome c550